MLIVFPIQMMDRNCRSPDGGEGSAVIRGHSFCYNFFFLKLNRYFMNASTYSLAMFLVLKDGDRWSHCDVINVYAVALLYSS